MLFRPALNRPWKSCKFCSENCRKEFHKYGGINFHKQRAWFEAEAKKWQKQAVERGLRALDKILANIHHRLEDLEALEIEGDVEDGQA